MRDVPVDWLKGHVEAVRKLIVNELVPLMKAHRLEGAAYELNHTVYSLNRAIADIERANQ